MKTQTVSLTELKQKLGTFINHAAYSGDRIVLLSHGKERAALISMEDLHLLETINKKSADEQNRLQQQAHLSADRQLREKMGDAGYRIDSTQLIEEVREEQLDDLMDMLRRLSVNRLRVANDFLAYLESKEATEELLSIPGFEDAFNEAVIQAQINDTTPFSTIKKDV